MDDADRARLEAQVRALCQTGDHRAAAAALVRGYGPEIFGFLSALHAGGAVDANDAFSEVAEAIWRGLPRFTWESSARTWAYAVARNVSRMLQRTATRRRRRMVQETDGFFEGVVQQVRTQTTAFLRTEKRTRLQALRDALSEEDRTLLVLRIDRGLSWNDLARVVGQRDTQDDDATPEALDEAAVAREAARLRKRFQLVKDRLRASAKREGLSD